MSQSSVALAGLVGSRLCHDLISPIGAIQNGLELVSLAGDADTGAEMALITDSCDNATGRIKFYRVAFGTASTTQSLSAREAASTLEAVTRSGKVGGDWQIGGDLPRTHVQLALLAFLCCEAALPVGGTVVIDRARDVITITGAGPRTRVQPQMWAFLSGGGDLQDVTPDRVQFALLATLAPERGLAVSAQADESGLRIEIG